MEIFKNIISHCGIYSYQTKIYLYRMKIFKNIISHCGIYSYQTTKYQRRYIIHNSEIMQFGRKITNDTTTIKIHEFMNY